MRRLAARCGDVSMLPSSEMRDVSANQIRHVSLVRCQRSVYIYIYIYVSVEKGGFDFQNAVLQGKVTRQSGQGSHKTQATQETQESPELLKSSNS